MDNEPVTAKSLSYTYMIDSGTFEKNYKDVLSDFRTWSQRDHASDWVLLPENMGLQVGIDETSFCHEVYTILHNKDGHGRKRTVIAIIKGTKPSDVVKVLMSLPEEKRLKVTDITMDLSNSMGAIAKSVFPNAKITRDCFHVVQRCGEGIEEIRLRLKREAVKEQKREKAEFKKKLERLAKQRKAYRRKHKRPKGKKRGRKPMRLSTRFVPSTLGNEETKVECLTRCKKQMLKSRDKWTDAQEERAKLLFDMYPKLKEAYSIVNSLRNIFKNKSLTKDSAKERLHEWYGKVTESTLREIKSVRDTIKAYEDEILNYFKSRATNASAESLNSKLKAFRSQLRGVRDIPFFFYRVSLIFWLALPRTLSGEPTFLPNLLY